jgi:hypothetical protein
MPAQPCVPDNRFAKLSAQIPSGVFSDPGNLHPKAAASDFLDASVYFFHILFNRG